MELWVWLLLSGLTVTMALSALLIKTKPIRRPQEDVSVTVEALRSALSPVTIQAIHFIREKINLTVNDVYRLDLDTLKATGIKSLNVVGQTLKFNYATPTVTQAVFETLKNDQESQVN